MGTRTGKEPLLAKHWFRALVGLPLLIAGFFGLVITVVHAGTRLKEAAGAARTEDLNLLVAFFTAGGEHGQAVLHGVLLVLGFLVSFAVGAVGFQLTAVEPKLVPVPKHTEGLHTGAARLTQLQPGAGRS